MLQTFLINPKIFESSFYIPNYNTESRKEVTIIFGLIAITYHQQMF